MKVKTTDENDEKSKEAKARKKKIAHDTITRVTRDGFSSSQESVGTGDIKRRNKKTKKKLSKRQIMQDRQLEEIGQSLQILSLIKEGLYRIQILCRRHPFWPYPAGLTIANPPG